MFTKTQSSSIREIEASRYSWPATTRPVVFAKKLVGKGSDARLEHYRCESALDMAEYLYSETETDLLLSVECHMVEDGVWVTRRIVELLVGKIADVEVAVYRDEESDGYCPDAPTIPWDRLSDLKSVGIVVGAERTRPLGVLASDRRSTSPSAVAANVTA